MRRIGIGFVGVLVASMLGGGSASAEEYEMLGLPEVGRCVKVPTGQGVYTGASCVTVNKTKTGRYEWTPASASEKLTFSGTGGTATIASTAQPTLTCTSTAFSGEYSSAKRAKVHVTLKGCTNSLAQQCKSLTAGAGEIESQNLQAEVGFIKNQVKGSRHIVIVGIDLRPESPETYAWLYTCGSITESARVEGSVIARIKPMNKMTTALTPIYTVTRGHQNPEKFDGRPKDTLTTTFMAGLTSTSAPSTLAVSSLVLHSTVALEIKATEK